VTAKMANTRIITQAFEYLVPKTIPEILDLLKRYGQQAKIIAGGTDLVNQLKQEKISPAYLINVMNIPELRFMKENGGLIIGAATKLRDLREYCLKRGKYTALYEAISVLGKPQVWNMGTVGGNLCNASPAADTAPPLLVFNGRVKLAGQKGERTLPLEDFFRGVNVTAMAPDEMMVAVEVDPMHESVGSAFMKTARVGADVSKISCAVALERKGDRCLSCRIALGAVAPVPMRAKAAEAMLREKKIEASLVEAAGKRVAAEVKPIDDVRSTAEYRRHMAGVMFKDVFLRAWERAGGEKA